MVLALYEPQLAKASTPCGVLSTGEGSVFILGLLALMGYGGFLEGPYPHRVASKRPPPVC